MESFWRINVSLNGQFYFNTDVKTYAKGDVLNLVQDFRKRFPATEGFKITTIRWECFGKDENF